MSSLFPPHGRCSQASALAPSCHCYSMYAALAPRVNTSHLLCLLKGRAPTHSCGRCSDLCIVKLQQLHFCLRFFWLIQNKYIKNRNTFSALWTFFLLEDSCFIVLHVCYKGGLCFSLRSQSLFFTSQIHQVGGGPLV